jgi:hypothetical protein
VAEALDQEAAVDEIVRAALRAIAAAGDEDALKPEAEAAVSAVLLHLVAEAAQAIPSRLRIPLLVNARELIDSFLHAVTHESA